MRNSGINDGHFEHYRLVGTSYVPKFAIPKSLNISIPEFAVPNLTQKFQTAGLFSQMIADKFFQKFRAFLQGWFDKFYPGGLGQFTAFNP